MGGGLAVGEHGGCGEAGDGDGRDDGTGWVASPMWTMRPRVQTFEPLYVTVALCGKRCRGFEVHYAQGWVAEFVGRCCSMLPRRRNGLGDDGGLLVGLMCHCRDRVAGTKEDHAKNLREVLMEATHALYSLPS